MATGLSNKLTGQVGEYLTCAELARRGMIATTFTGNVPEFDLIVCNKLLRAIPIQVKTSTGSSWRSRADFWMNIDFDDGKKMQIDKGAKQISNPDLIYVSVAMGEEREADRFFICEKTDIQTVCINAYTRWMNQCGWKRPRNYKSLDNRYTVSDLLPFENNWNLVADRLENQNAN